MRTALGNTVSIRAVRKRLTVLYERGYVRKREIESERKSIGEPAYYCLDNLGVEYLRQADGYNPVALRNIRHDVRASNRFARHCIGLFNAANELQNHFGGQCQIQTRSTFYGKEDFPNPLPDAYVRIKNANGEISKQFLIEYIDDTKPHRIWKQRLTQLIEYINNGEWFETDNDPALLFVCATARYEQYVKRWLPQIIEDTFAEDAQVFTATVKTVPMAITRVAESETQITDYDPDKPLVWIGY